jgi:hypothetical protein
LEQKVNSDKLPVKYSPLHPPAAFPKDHPMSDMGSPESLVKIVERHMGPFARPIVVVVVLVLLVVGGFWAAAHVHDDWNKLFADAPPPPLLKIPASEKPVIPTAPKEPAAQPVVPKHKIANQKGERIVSKDEEATLCDPNNRDRDELMCDPNNRNGYAYRREHQLPSCTVSSTGQKGGVTACNIETVNQ